MATCINVKEKNLNKLVKRDFLQIFIKLINNGEIEVEETTKMVLNEEWNRLESRHTYFVRMKSCGTSLTMSQYFTLRNEINRSEDTSKRKQLVYMPNLMDIFKEE